LYWKPVYGFIRVARRIPPEEAKDLTQGFFVELVEGEMLARYSPERGSFRTYLRGAVRLYVLEEHRDAHRLKRGGDRVAIPLNDGECRSMEDLIPDAETAPDAAFDIQWARDVVQHAMDDLQQDLEREGKGAYFRAFQKYELDRADSEAPTYDVIAQELGVKATDVANYLKHCRREMRRLISERIRDYVSEESEIGPELERLRGLLASH